jgi:ESCRT-II complex subunit VPS22
LLIASEQLENYNSYLKKFQEKLEEFSKKYSQEIKSKGEFRTQFLEMCMKIGVDPLASSKGFWGELLGIGDFYYELGIQILEIALATSHRNGGIISLSKIKEILKRDVSEEDILKSLNNIQVLGNGLELLKLNSEIFLGSVPRELNTDLLQVLEFVKSKKSVTIKDLIHHFSWESQRVSRAIVSLTISLKENLIKEGIFWVDEQVEPIEYWINF